MSVRVLGSNSHRWWVSGRELMGRSTGPSMGSGTIWAFNGSHACALELLQNQQQLQALGRFGQTSTSVHSETKSCVWTFETSQSPGKATWHLGACPMVQAVAYARDRECIYMIRHPGQFNISPPLAGDEKGQLQPDQSAFQSTAWTPGLSGVEQEWALVRYRFVGGEVETAAFPFPSEMTLSERDGNR